MFFEVLDVTYHSPITIDYITCATDVDEHGLVPQCLGSAIARELSARKATRSPRWAPTTIAIAADMGVRLVVIANALRLLRQSASGASRVDPARPLRRSIDGRACILARPSMMAYLQNGQQPPLPATFVAAAAVVPNTASANAMTPRSLAFIVIPRLWSGPSAKAQPYTFKLT